MSSLAVGSPDPGFGVNAQFSTLVDLLEWRARFQAERIRQRVAEEYEVQVYAVALIRQGTIAKTSSGEIQRNATRRAFVAGKLEVEFEWREAFTAAQVAAAEVTAIVAAGDGESPEVWLRGKVASVLRVPVAEIDVSQPITRYGLDSLMFVTLSRGGQVVLANNALQLVELPAASEVTLINTVPSAMTELLRMRAGPDSVRVVNLAGEPLTEELVAEIYATTKAERVYNLYGPSGYTTYST